MSQNRYTDWTVRTLIKLKHKGQVVVNNPAQRGPTWKRDTKKRSLFINSVIIDLPEELENKIKEFSLTVQYRENASQDEIRDAMLRQAS